MKKVFLIILFLAIATQYGFSQFFVGGDLSYQYDTSSEILNNSKQSYLIISPLLGYRFDKTDVGLLFSYRLENFSSTQTSASSENYYSNERQDVGFGIFGSYNIFSVDRFSIYGRATVKYIRAKYTTKDSYTDNTVGSPYYSSSDKEQNKNTIEVGISPIFEYKLFEHFSLYSSIGLISFSHSWGDISGNSFYSFLSTGIGLGFNIYF